LDVVYFLSTHLPIRITSFLILLPATQLTRVLGNAGLQEAMGSLPWLVQFFWRFWWRTSPSTGSIERCTWCRGLWRFHAIHHSSKSLDWIAGSRAHIVDDVLIRGLMLIPMMFVFSQGIIVAYLSVRHHPRHLGAYELRPDHQVAGAVLDLPEIPPLASHVAEESRSTRTSPSTSRGSTSCSAPTTP
jgi:hypothetical protein